MTWGNSKTKGISQFPEGLEQALEALLPQTRGYTRRVFIALVSLYVSPSCPEEARNLLLEWVEAASLDPNKRHPTSLAKDFAEAVLAHQPKGQ